MPKEIPVFWGCTISQRFPYLENTSRKVLNILGIQPKDIEGVSCCPDPLYAHTLPHMTWLTMAARNLALAEKAGTSMMTMCNGCYKVLKTAEQDLKDAGMREQVNDRLGLFGLNYEDRIKPTHFLEHLKLGKQEINVYLKKKLSGLKVAVHYGCHILRPREIAIDNMQNPQTLEDLLKNCGATIVEYTEKMLCCGGTLAPFDESASQDMLRRKIKSVKAAGADCLVVVCPSCYLQYDLQARNLKKEFQIPVFHLMELLAIAFGIPVEDLNIQRHAIDLHPALDKLGIAPKQVELQKHFNLKHLSTCCGSCSYECTVAMSQPDAQTHRFDPLVTVRKVVAGDIESAIRNEDIWRCLGCYDCSVFCPQGEGLGHMFETLRQLAIERGLVPESAKARLEMLSKTGCEVQGSEAARKKMGLPPAPKAKMEEIEKILSETCRH